MGIVLGRVTKDIFIDSNLELVLEHCYSIFKDCLAEYLVFANWDLQSSIYSIIAKELHYLI